MARGAVSKEIISKKILEIFEGSFKYNDGKEIRIPLQEDGEEIQIKVALTCAKDNVSPGQDNAIPGAAAQTIAITTMNTPVMNTEKKETVTVEPTAEEKQNVSDLLRALGL